MTIDCDELVSVVIPLYNAEKYIEQALNSVIGQSYGNFEIVLVDDGSTDSSVEIALSYDSKVRLLQQKNSGPAIARNTGVKEAKGKWIAFLDADDIWLPDKLKLQLLNIHDKKWGYCNSMFMGGVNDGRRDSDLNEKPEGDILAPLACNNFIGTSGVILQRQVFLDEGGFDTNLRSIQDWDLWLRVAAKYPIAYVDEPLVKYRVHTASTSRSARKTLPNHLLVINKNFVRNGSAGKLTHLYKTAKANSYSICSHIAEEEGDMAFSLRCAINACLIEGGSMYRWMRIPKLVIKHCLKVFGIRKFA